MSFETPWMFILLAIFLPFIFLRHRSLRFAATAFLPKGIGTPLYRLAERGLFFLAGLAIVMALARPTLRGGTEKRMVRDRDFLLLIDFSGSMDEPFVARPPDSDFDDDIFNVPGFMHPSFFNPRLLGGGGSKISIALTVARQFVAEHSVDRIGIMIFSGEPYLIHQLTHNHESLIDWLSAAQNTFGGTNIPPAFLAAGNHMNERGGVRGARALILLSDGEDDAITNHAGEMKKILEDLGIRLWWLRVKTKGQENTMLTCEEALKALAIGSGGGMYNVTSENDLKAAFHSVSLMEARPVLVEVEVPFRDLAPLCIFASAIICVAFWFLTAFKIN